MGELAVAAAALLLAAPAAGQAPGADGEWPMAARDHASTRYSPLGDITAANVKDLKVAWTFDTGIPKGQEAAPVVVGATMYLVTPFPNKVYALDLAKPGAPVKWRYAPEPVRAAQGVAC